MKIFFSFFSLFSFHFSLAANLRPLRAGNASLAFLLLIFYFSLFTFHFSLPQETGWPIIRNYTPKEYGGDAQVWDILQDKNTGIMYFGVTPGIISYDGARWEKIPTPKQSYANGLCQSEDGTIYVAGTDDFGFLKTDKKGQTVYQSLINLLPDTSLKMGTVWSVKAAGDAINFLAYDHIFRYTPADKKIQVFQSDSGTFFGDFAHEGQYYTRMKKRGLVKINKEGMENAPKGEFFKTIGFREAAVFDPYTLLIATAKSGMFLYRPSSGLEPQTFQIADTSFLSENPVYSVNNTPSGGFLIGSLKKGLLITDGSGNTLEHFEEGKLLPSNSVYTSQNYAGQPLWLGLANGISKMPSSGRAWGYLGGKSGLKGSVLAITRYAGRFFVATDQNIYFIDEKGTPVEVQNIPAGEKWALLEHGGKLLAGTKTGIYSIGEDNKAEQIHQGSHAYVLYPSRSNPNRLYASDGDQGFISLLYENGKWTGGAKWAGIKETIRGVAEDGEGFLWLGTFTNGLIRLRPGIDKIEQPTSIKQYGKKEGLPILNNCQPYWFNSRLLVGTEKGLMEYDKKTDRFLPYCGLGNRFCDGSQDIYRLKEMKNGRIYISPYKNKTSDIGYLKPDGKGGYVWVFQAFRNLPYIASLDDIYAEENGQLWIGGSEGLFRYDEKADSEDYGQVFKTWVREVRNADDSTVFFGGGPGTATAAPQIYLYANNSLKFLYAASFFNEEQRTLYSHKLEGFDEHWSHWTNHTEKEYTNLYEGEYSFLVKAKNIYGIESETRYAFTINPPLYRTWWAYVLYLIASGFAVFAIVKWNILRLVKQKEFLEDLVEKRTEELAGKNKELAYSNQEINYRNQEILQQNEEIQQQADILASQRDGLEQSYENVRLISEIGKEITHHIEVEEIIDTVYAEVNKLMPAEVFGIGIFKEKENTIVFPGTIEKGLKLELYSDDLGEGDDDNDSLSDLCFKKKQEILLNDWDTEITNFLPKGKVLAGEKPDSVIYLPLLVQGKAVGNITVQSFYKNAYNENHINLLRNIALYTAIALDNASAYEKIDKEKEKSEKLLLNILPKNTADELKETGHAVTRRYDNVTVLFTDFKGFTQIAEKMTPEEVVQNLDYCFQAFDDICIKHRLEKIKTIGDSYMAAGGIPTADDDNAIRAVEAALEMNEFMKNWKAAKKAVGEKIWEVRIGIHSGPVVAGVVGKNKFAYDIWGDTVNTASRMESSGEPSQINISEATYRLVKDRFACTYRGEMTAKNKGRMGMYFVEIVNK